MGIPETMKKSDENFFRSLEPMRDKIRHRVCNLINHDMDSEEFPEAAKEYINEMPVIGERLPLTIYYVLPKYVDSKPPIYSYSSYNVLAGADTNEKPIYLQLRLKNYKEFHLLDFSLRGKTKLEFVEYSNGLEIADPFFALAYFIEVIDSLTWCGYKKAYLFVSQKIRPSTSNHAMLFSHKRENEVFATSLAIREDMPPVSTVTKIYKEMRNELATSPLAEFLGMKAPETRGGNHSRPEQDSTIAMVEFATVMREQGLSWKSIYKEFGIDYPEYKDRWKNQDSMRHAYQNAIQRVKKANSETNPT